MGVHLVISPKRCASTSSSGLPVNSGLKLDQFNWSIGPGWIGCVGGTINCAGGAGNWTGGTEGTTGGITGVSELHVVLHQPYLFMLKIV